MINQYRYVISFLICLVFSMVICWSAIYGPLVLDDYQNLSGLININETNYTSIIFSNESGPLGRSVSMATFALNHWLSGGINVFHLKLTNLLIHFVNALLVFLITGALLEKCREIEHHQLLALFIASCWLLSPININVVFYTIQRMALLSAFFILAGCWVYIKGRHLILNKGKARYPIIVVLFLIFFFAILSKENGALLPVMIFLIEICFYNNLFFYLKSRLSSRIITLLILFFIASASLIYFFWVKEYLDYSFLHFTLTDRLYTQPVVIVDYIKNIIIPFNIGLGLSNDHFEIERNFLNFNTLSSGLFLFLILIVSFYGVIKNKKRYLFFGLLFFMAGHLIESTIFPLEIYFSH